MPSFTRTYTQGFVDKVLHSLLELAQTNEGHRKIQEALAGLGATQDDDGIYQIDSVPAKEQVGLMFDLFIWRNYRRYDAREASEAAIEQSTADTEDDFEHGGAA